MTKESSMIKQSLITLVLAAIGVCTAQAATDAAAAKKLQDYLGSLTTFEARFVQRIAGAQSDGEESSGKFYLQRPGSLRWEYEKPQTQLVVTDGQRLWVYDKELRQVTVRAMDAALAATPAMLLAGKQNVIDGFDVSSGPAR